MVGNLPSGNDRISGSRDGNNNRSSSANGIAAIAVSVIMVVVGFVR